MSRPGHRSSSSAPKRDRPAANGDPGDTPPPPEPAPELAPELAYDPPSAAAPDAGPAVAPDGQRAARPHPGVDDADRDAFRLGANLLTLVALVLAGWWLWRHVLAPALLGPG